jgi:hypothetical protein
MTAGVSTAVANAMLTGATGTGDMAFAGLATGDPGSAGTSNPSSTTTREGVTWGSPSSAVVSASNQPAWPSWAGTSGEVVSWIILMSASSGGTFGASMQLASSVTMLTGDTLTLTVIQISLPVAS